jgi:hypothetical protein
MTIVLPFLGATYRSSVQIIGMVGHTPASLSRPGTGLSAVASKRKTSSFAFRPSRQISSGKIRPAAQARSACPFCGLRLSRTGRGPTGACDRPAPAHLPGSVPVQAVR